MSVSQYKTKSSIRYRVHKMINGIRYSKSFTTHKEAEDWLNLICHYDSSNVLGKLAKAELNAITEEKIQSSTPTFKDVVRDYQQVDLGLKCDHGLKKLDYFFEFWADKSISSINRMMVENALDDLAVKRNLAGPTVNRYQASISSLYRWASQQRKYRELQLNNPTIGIVRRKESKGREVFLTKEQQSLLLHECKKSKWSGLYVLIALLLATGARRNEIAELKWENVNLKDGFIKLLDTKNGDDHVISINSTLITLLKTFKLESLLSAWVFPHIHNPRKPMVNFDHYWKVAKEASDMPNNLRVHDLRHTTASTMLADGFSLEDIKQTLNHKSVHMTNRYAHHAKVVNTVSKRDVSHLIG